MIDDFLQRTSVNADTQSASSSLGLVSAADFFEARKSLRNLHQSDHFVFVLGTPDYGAFDPSQTFHPNLRDVMEPETRRDKLLGGLMGRVFASSVYLVDIAKLKAAFPLVQFTMSDRATQLLALGFSQGSATAHVHVRAVLNPRRGVDYRIPDQPSPL